MGRAGDPPEVFDATSCRAKTAGHPWPAPCGLGPVGRLASATGPEGETRRLFQALRFRGVERTAGWLVVLRSTRLALHLDVASTRQERCGNDRLWVGADSSATPR